ncbi:hypothetical protein U1Q18_009888, partial [Sarracenia purpurea var. burkii]
MNRDLRKRYFTNQFGVLVNLDSDEKFPSLAGTKEIVIMSSRLSKLAYAMVSTATDLKEEVIQVKKENVPLGSLRMTTLEARIKRLKGISPMRINEFASELNWSRVVSQLAPVETKEVSELVEEGLAPTVNDNKVKSDPKSCELDAGDIGPVSLEAEPVLAIT